jgi:hypothetical protein
MMLGRFSYPAAVLVVVGLLLGACGDDAADELPVDAPADAAAGPSAAACLVGEPDCQDVGAMGADAPDELPLPGAEPVGGGLSVGDALAADIDGGFAIQAFYLQDASGTWLCDALAESFPPQCGADRIELDIGTGLDVGALTQEQGVSWSEDLVIVVGEIIDGAFVATPMSG